MATSCVLLSWVFSWTGFPAEVRRLRSDGEKVSAQAEREKQALTQTLNAAQLEAQQALHKAISEHQEEAERLVSEKVRKWMAPGTGSGRRPVMAALFLSYRRFYGRTS